MGAMKKSPLALGIMAVLFAGWLVYLGVQAPREPELRDQRPVVSRSQLMIAQYDVDVDLPAGTLPARVKVERVRWSVDARKPEGGIAVAELPRTQGVIG